VKVGLNRLPVEGGSGKPEGVASDENLVPWVTCARRRRWSPLVAAVRLSGILVALAAWWSPVLMAGCPVRGWALGAVLLLAAAVAGCWVRAGRVPPMVELLGLLAWVSIVLLAASWLLGGPGTLLKLAPPSTEGCSVVLDKSQVLFNTYVDVYTFGAGDLFGTPRGSVRLHGSQSTDFHVKWRGEVASLTRDYNPEHTYVADCRMR